MTARAMACPGCDCDLARDRRHPAAGTGGPVDLLLLASSALTRPGSARCQVHRHEPMSFFGCDLSARLRPESVQPVAIVGAPSSGLKQLLIAGRCRHETARELPPHSQAAAAGPIAAGAFAGFRGRLPDRHQRFAAGHGPGRAERKDNGLRCSRSASIVDRLCHRHRQGCRMCSSFYAATLPQLGWQAATSHAIAGRASGSPSNLEGTVPDRPFHRPPGQIPPPAGRCRACLTLRSSESKEKS